MHLICKPFTQKVKFFFNLTLVKHLSRIGERGLLNIIQSLSHLNTICTVTALENFSVDCWCPWTSQSHLNRKLRSKASVIARQRYWRQSKRKKGAHTNDCLHLNHSSLVRAHNHRAITLQRLTGMAQRLPIKREAELTVKRWRRMARNTWIGCNIYPAQHESANPWQWADTNTMAVPGPLHHNQTRC